MDVLLAGGSGFIGQELGLALTRVGYNVHLLSRSPEKIRGLTAFPATSVVGWNEISKRRYDVVINLCGESVADTPWSAEGKQRLASSRIATTKELAEKVQPPGLWIQASAVGFYGNRPGEELNEDSVRGEGFLATLCDDWEKVAPSQNSRLVVMRLGVVLGLDGGILGTLDSLYARGLGASLGEHFLPWIHIEDVCASVVHFIKTPSCVGVFNLTAPTPVPFRTFHEALKEKKKVMALPAPPSFVLRLALGEKASFILADQKVLPRRLLESGFQFGFATMVEALADIYKDQLRDGVYWITRKLWLPKTTAELWPFFTDEYNLERITPPLLQFHVKDKSTPKIEKDTLIRYRLKLRGLPMGWTSRIAVWDEHREFVDTQINGPYQFWYHRHLFESLGSGTLCTDRVQYKLPMGMIGNLVASSFVRKDVEAIFRFRNQTLKEIFG